MFFTDYPLSVLLLDPLNQLSHIKATSTQFNFKLQLGKESG
jgi:hypothetical protein